MISEANRCYKPDGCFLANLFNADKDSIKIALTGTLILKEEKSSCLVFGDYFHAYYYDKSIQDGYALKILREEIETSYRKRLTEAYQKLEKLVTKGELKKQRFKEHKFKPESLAQYNEENKAMDDIYKKIRTLRRKDDALQKQYGLL